MKRNDKIINTMEGERMTEKDIIIEKQNEFINALLKDYNATYKMYDVNNTFANGIKDDGVVESDTGFETYDELDGYAYEVGLERKQIGKELEKLTGRKYE